MRPMIPDVLLAAVQAHAQARPRSADQSTLVLQGTEVTATSPEGKSASMSIAAFLAKVAARRMDTGGVVLPDGVKAIMSEGPITIWVYECPPAVHRFLWIAADSPVPFGPGTKYRTVRLALPYLIVLVVFGPDQAGTLQLSTANECFFRVEPLKSLEDALHYPALLNCSRFEPQEGRPLSWICTQHLKPTPPTRDPDLSRRLKAGFLSLRHCLFETGFNLSSEHHESSSWFTESSRIDPRIATVEAWEAASLEKPLFVLEVPWIPTHHSVRQVADRIFRIQQAQAKAPQTAAALARLVFNQQ